MKYLVLLALIGCSDYNKEPWAVGDCVEYAPRKTYLTVKTVRLVGDEYYYGLEEYREEKREKVLRRVECDQ